MCKGPQIGEEEAWGIVINKRYSYLQLPLPENKRREKHPKQMILNNMAIQKIKEPHEIESLP